MDLYSNQTPREDPGQGALYLPQHVSAKNNQRFNAPKHPIASHELEAEAIRHLVVIHKMKEKGMDYDPIIHNNPQRALVMIERDAAHCFTPAVSNHVCMGSSDAHWKLEEMERLRQIRGKVSVKGGGRAEWNDEYARLSKASNSGCSFSKLEENQAFYHLRDGKTYLATGEVYICILSGQAHVCNAQQCTRQVNLPRDEGIECELTHKFYGQPVVYAEERNREFEACKDGGVSYTSRGGPPRYNYFSKSRTNGSATRKRKQQSDRANDAMENKMKASDPDSALKWAPGHDIPYIEEHLKTLLPRVKVPVPSRTGKNAVAEVCGLLIYDKTVRRVMWSKLKEAESQAMTEVQQHYKEQHSKGKFRDPFEVMSIVSRHVKPHFDRLRVIGFFDQDPERRVLTYFHDAIITVWHLLHYTPYAQRFQNGIPLTAKHVIGILYKLQTGFYVNVTYDPTTKRVISFNSSNTEDLSTPPPTERQQIDPTPPKKRKTSPPSLGKLSSLNSDSEGGSDSESLDQQRQRQEQAMSELERELLEGLNPDQELLLPAAADVPPPPATKLICFIPRHTYLQRMPQKNDLNKYPVFKSAGFSSSQVVNTDKLISECYESLVTKPGCTLDGLLDFALEMYINLREFT